MSEVNTVEQILRNNGWIEKTLGDSKDGDQVMILRSGQIGVVKHAHERWALVTHPDKNYSQLDGDCVILRAPRPEPEYEPGTVVWGRLNGEYEYQAFIRCVNEDCPWVGVDGDGVHDRWPEKAVEVDHIIAHPDGTTPAPVLGPVTDEQLLAALNAHERENRDYDYLAPWEDESSLDFWTDNFQRIVRVQLEAYRDTLTTGETEEPGDTAESITLERIRAEEREAWAQIGTIWRWNSRAEEFQFRNATSNHWYPAASATLTEATAPGYFTGWAEQEDGE